MEPGTLSIVMERQAEEIQEPDFAAYVPLVSFEAFLGAQRLFGWVRLEADRLTDLLNAHDLLRLVNVHVEEHHDGSIVAADETLIPRAELVAVVASGPRGDPVRRVATGTHAVAANAGAYRIVGRLHVPPGVDPTERWHEGGPMIPLTEATFEYRSGTELRRASRRTVIVNRGAVTSIEATSPDDAVWATEESMRAPGLGRR
jgi:hypothetical protein